MPTLTPESLPQQVVWESYVGQVDALNGPICLKCQESPCATCPISWWPVTQSDDGTVTATASLDGCPAIPMVMGPCGQEVPCTTWATTKAYPRFTFSLVLNPEGSGYRLVYRTEYTSGDNHFGDWGSCDRTIYNLVVQGTQPLTAAVQAIRDVVVAANFPCAE
jgi:hypothetical protein